MTSAAATGACECIGDVRMVEALADLRLGQHQPGQVAARMEPTDRCLVEA
jgi:hypothetical protein